MKYFLLTIILFFSVTVKAQKFVLLDEHIAAPVKYANTVTSADNFYDFFPVEKKLLPQFLKILEEIKDQLSLKESNKIKNFELGCIKFKGILISLASGQRTDYVLTSACDNVKISMHLCDAKFTNDINAYFITTWIKYIQTYLSKI